MKAHPERLFLMRLARELGMSKRRLLQSADALKAKFQALAPVKKDGGNKRKG